MNRELLDALGAVAADFYWDAMDRYPCLMFGPRENITDEALVVWNVLMNLDELAVAIHDAQIFDNRRPLVEAQEELPF